MAFSCSEFFIALLSNIKSLLDTYFDNKKILGYQNHLFIRDGFSFIALVFPLFYSIWNGLWVLTIILIIYFFGLTYLITYFESFNSIIFLIILIPHIIFSYEARELKGNNLIKKGWRKVGLVVAKNIVEAELKFYSSRNNINLNKEPK